MQMLWRIKNLKQNQNKINLYIKLIIEFILTQTIVVLRAQSTLTLFSKKNLQTFLVIRYYNIYFKPFHSTSASPPSIFTHAFFTSTWNQFYVLLMKKNMTFYLTFFIQAHLSSVHKEQNKKVEKTAYQILIEQEQKTQMFRRRSWKAI